MKECKFNSAAECEEPSQCAKCGWNPHVAARRIQKVRQKKASRPTMRIDPKAIGCSFCLGSGLLQGEDGTFLIDHVARDKFLLLKDGWDVTLFRFPCCPQCGRLLAEKV